MTPTGTAVPTKTTAPAGTPARSGNGAAPPQLTGRGAVLGMFAACFLGLLMADWLDWRALAGAVFFTCSGLAAFYVRPGSLLPVAVSPPCAFFLACACEKAITGTGAASALDGTVTALADSASWLFAGTALTLAIAIGRGLVPQIRRLVTHLRDRS